METGSIDNKSTFTGAVRFSTFQKDYVQPVLREDMGKDIISHGNDNLYPVFLRTLFLNSSTHGSIISGKTDFIAGRGLKSKSNDKALTKFIKTVNRKGDDLEDIFKKVALSHQIHGGFCLEIIWAKGSTTNNPRIAEINFADISCFRWNRKADGLLYLKDWNFYKWKLPTTDNFIPEPFSLYNPTNPKGKQIYYYAGLTTNNFYPEPYYVNATTNIETDIEISNYHKSIISSGLFPNIMCTFHNGVPSESEMVKIEKSFTDKFGGTDKAGKVVFSYAEPGQEAATITPIQENDADKKFLNSAEATANKIYAAHKASPALFGIASAGKLGDNQQLKVSYDIFKKLVIEPTQLELLKKFNQILSTTFKIADLDIIQIPALLNYFTEERIIAANMTNPEVRKVLLSQGMIDSLDLEGLPIGDKNITNLNEYEHSMTLKNIAETDQIKAQISQTEPTTDNPVNAE